MPNFLLVPIRVDALFVQQGEPVVQALADFSFLPWVDEAALDTDFRNSVKGKTSPQVINGDVAYISENFVAQPFSDTNLMLPEGVHLHWALPDALTTGRHPRLPDGTPDPASKVYYPAIPNRWLVIREDKTKWVVESDYLYKAGSSPAQSMRPATWPLAGDIENNVQPYRFLGRRVTVTGSYAEDTAKDADFLHKHNETLTAFGYGEPGWHAFYPDCHSVLGLHDESVDDTPPSTAAYQVFGWYAVRPGENPKPPADVFKTFVDNFNAGKLLGKTSLDALVRKTLNYADSTPATLADADYQKAFLWHLDHEFSWRVRGEDIPLDPTSHNVLLGGVICYGSVHFTGNRESDATADGIKIVVGNTGTEALSAYLAALQVAKVHPVNGAEQKQQQFENQLESLTLAPTLQGQSIDLGPKFFEARHEKSFTAVTGGVLWKLRPPGITHPDPNTAPAKAVRLPAALQEAITAAGLAASEAVAAAVATANRLQSAYERGRQTIRSLRRRIFADWYKYMVCRYHPVEARESDYPDLDDVRRFVEMEVAELYLLQAFTGEVATTTDKTTGAFDTAGSTWRSAQKQIHLDLLRAESISFLGYEFANRLDRIAPLSDQTAASQRRQYFQTDNTSEFETWLTTEFMNWCALSSGGALTLPDEVLAVFRPLYDKDDPAVDSRYGSPETRQFQSIADLLAGSLTKLSALIGKVNAVATAAATATKDIASNVADATISADFISIAVALSDGEFATAINALVPAAQWAELSQEIAPIIETLSAQEGDDLQAALVKAITTAFPSWTLQAGVAPRFWQPNEPVLLLAGSDAVQATDRHGADGDLVCSMQKSDVRTADDAAPKLAATLDALTITPDPGPDDPSPIEVTPFAPRTTGGNPWHALYLEWEVGVLPVRDQGNIPPEERHFGPYFVRDNYSIGGTGIEFLQRQAKAQPTSSSTLVIGRSLITPHALASMDAAIQNYIADLTLRYLQEKAKDLEGTKTQLSPEEENLLSGNNVTALVEYYKTNSVWLAVGARHHAALVRKYLQRSGATLTAEEKALLSAKGLTKLIAYFSHHKQDIMTWATTANVAFDPPVKEIVHAAYSAINDDTQHIQAQSITGFNAALLMQRQSLQLPVADPLAFPEYSDFTKKVVSDAVADQNHTAPEPLFDFVPIRAGDLRFERLRLVDSFGRTLDLNADTVTPILQMKSYLSNWTAIPPRITQPARLSFRFLAADGSFVESNSHPLTSPVCGWLIANNLDGSLMIYDTEGFALGYVDEEGSWRPPPGGRGPVLVEDIANPHLSRAVKWICRSAQESGNAPAFMQDFLDLFESALDNIAPDNSAQHQARVLLMSRPVALVRTAIDIQVQGAYAEHLGWEAFRRRMQGHPPKSDNYVDVQFPVRIGDYRQFNDGVVAYWIEDGDDYVERYVLSDSSLDNLEASGLLTDEQLAQLGKVEDWESFGRRHFEILLSETLGEEAARGLGSTIAAAAERCRPLFAPQSLVSQKSDLARRAGQQQLALEDRFDLFDPDQPSMGESSIPMSINFHQSLAEPVRVATILMDPRGLVHCHTGVLPAKALSIPPEHYVEALRRIQVTFLTAPILTDPRAALVPLPSEPGFKWSWVQKDGTTWTRLDTTPVVFQADILAAYPDDGPQVWQELLAKNWLEAVPGKNDRATVAVKDKQQGLEPVWKTPALDTTTKAKWVNDVQRAVDLCARGLRPTHEEARFGPAQELREGWLTLTPEPGN